MAVPVIVLAFRKSAVRATLQTLACGGQVEVHAAAGIRLNRRDGARLLSSITVLPPPPCGDEQVVETVLALARRVGAEALVPVYTEDVALVARNREALADAHPVPVPDSGLLEQLVDKRRFVRLAESLGLPTPPTLEMVPTLDVDDAIDRLGLPMLAKPVIGEGGKGIVEIADAAALRRLLEDPAAAAGMVLQRKMPGEDVALTLLADRGKVFAVMIRRRWFSRWRSRPFSPIVDVEFLQEDWLEEAGREFVRRTQFSGIADFDLKVDFESRRLWFLESDPRMIGGLPAALLFGVNIPWLLVEQARGGLAAGYCARPETGHYLSLRSIPEWMVRGAWRHPRRGPVRTRWKTVMSDPMAVIDEMVPSFSRGSGARGR